MLIDKFLEYLFIERKYSSLTILAYKKDLEQFEFFIESQPLIKVETKTIRIYLSTLVDLELQPSSINRKLSSLKSFYKFLLEMEIIEKSPTLGLRNLTLSHKVIIPFSEKEMKDLFEFDHQDNQSFEGVRNVLIIELLYYTGIRRAELINLEWNDLNFDTKQIKVLGKGNKLRLIPIGNNLIELFNTYKLTLLNNGLQGNKHVFITNQGKIVYPKLVYEVVKSYLGRVSSKNKKSPHMLRHSFATHMLNNGADINAVKELLGHSSLAATQIYTHSNIDELKKIFSSNHPRNLNN